MNQKDQPPGLLLPERFVPTPKSVSPQAQAFLTQGLPVTPPELAVDDLDGWRSYIAQVNGHLAMAGKARSEQTPCSISEHRLSNVTLYEVEPQSGAAEGKAIYHIHGGAFIVGGGIAAAYSAMAVAHAAGVRSYSVDYRMPPDHPFPHGLDDALEGYRFLLDRYAPEDIVVEGSSAGANIAAAMILKARDEGLPLPAGCVLHTAGVDLTDSGDTMQTNRILDVVLRTPDNNAIALYCGDHDRTDPYLSPLFGDIGKGFPPTQLLSGTRDMLLSPTVMMHRALRRAGIAAELHVFEAMPHGGFGHHSPEDQERLGETGRFVKEMLGIG